MRSAAIIRHIEKMGGSAGFSRTAGMLDAYYGKAHGHEFYWGAWPNGSVIVVHMQSPFTDVQTRCTTLRELDNALRIAKKHNSKQEDTCHD